MAQVPTALDYKWLILDWLWLVMFSQSSVLRVKVSTASDHIVVLSKDTAFCTESWNVENFSFRQPGWGNHASLKVVLGAPYPPICAWLWTNKHWQGVSFVWISWLAPQQSCFGHVCHCLIRWFFRRQRFLLLAQMSEFPYVTKIKHGQSWLKISSRK